MPPIHSCQTVPAGLTVQLDRPTVFEQVLTALPAYTKPPLTSQGPCIILNCVPLHGQKELKSLSLGHLRAILVTDHLAGLLQAQGLVHGMSLYCQSLYRSGSKNTYGFPTPQKSFHFGLSRDL